MVFAGVILSAVFEGTQPFVCRLHCVDVLAGLFIAWIAHSRSDEWMSVRGYCEL